MEGCYIDASKASKGSRQARSKGGGSDLTSRLQGLFFSTLCRNYGSALSGLTHLPFLVRFNAYYEGLQDYSDPADRILPASPKP